MKKPTKKPTPVKTSSLLSAHVPTRVYEELKRRAKGERRSISQFVALFLESNLFHGEV